MTRKKYAIIGCGKAAQKHIKAAIHNKSEVVLTALCDLNMRSMSDLLQQSDLSKREISTVKLYTDLDEMLEKEDLNIASVVTPGGTHFDIAKKIISKGIDILLEKPMTLCVSQADFLNRYAAEKGVKIAMGHIYRYFPLVSMLAEELKSSRMGEILYGDVKVFWGHGQEYYDFPSWRGTWSQDGGVIMNQTIHAIDLMAYLMNDTALEVTGMLGRQTHEMEAEDIGMGIVRMKGGSYMTVTGTTSSDPDFPEAHFHVLCTKGVIKAGIRKGKPYFDITVNNKSRSMGYLFRYILQVIREDGWKWLLRIGNPHSRILKDIVSCSGTDKTPIADGISGSASVQNVTALYLSAKRKSNILLPLSEGDSEKIFKMDL